MVWMVKENLINAQPASLVGCSMNMDHNAMLSAVSQMGIKRGKQIKT